MHVEQPQLVWPATGRLLLLEGSVRHSGSQVRMNAQLIDVETGGHLRAERFETDRRNLAEAENGITGCVAGR